jgi:hypothetical protein
MIAVTFKVKDLYALTNEALNKFSSQKVGSLSFPLLLDSRP